MILVDKALQAREAEGNPIRVGIIGAGFMGRGITLQIITSTPGMRVSAISNRHIDGAQRAYEEADVQEIEEVETEAAFTRAVERARPVITNDPKLICRSELIDAVIEVTGTVEFAAGVILEAIEHGKHVVMMNAEVDGTVGPILKARADRAGVVLTNSDGDQPGVIMNLYRFVKGIGLTPVLCGNIKGLHDPYRNPTTQESFARQWGQRPSMVTSFADGTKISFEQTIVANATGMRVARRGMHGIHAPGMHVREAIELFPLQDLLNGDGIVDYLVGAEPAPGVFVAATHQHPRQRHYLNLYKLGEGPLYCFYTPYHLCHFEVPNTVARAVIFGDATLAPSGAPYVDVIAAAKVDLESGTVLDGLGGYMTYGLAENSDIVDGQNLLPIGVAEGCRLTRSLEKDSAISYDDVETPPGRLTDKLRAEQSHHFSRL